MKALKRREVIDILKAAGFAYDGEGRHPIFKCSTSGFRIPVPNGREISPGTLRDILKLLDKARELQSIINK